MLRVVDKSFLAVGRARARDPVRARLDRRRRPRHRADRAAVGRPRAGVPAAPRDLVDQFGLPLLRAQALRRRRRVAQRVLAGPAVDGRGLAPQPPRLPDLGLPRPQAAGSASPTRPGWSSPAWRSSAWCGTSCASSPERQAAKLLPTVTPTAVTPAPAAVGAAQRRPPRGRRATSAGAAPAGIGCRPCLAACAVSPYLLALCAGLALAARAGALPHPARAASAGCPWMNRALTPAARARMLVSAHDPGRQDRHGPPI